jgi:hypothetical protein
LTMMMTFELTKMMLASVNTTTSVPGSENGLIVALGGIVGIVLFFTIILLRVLKKRKKSMH